MEHGTPRHRGSEPIARRSFFATMSGGLCGAALVDLLSRDLRGADGAAGRKPSGPGFALDPRAPHFAPRARAVIHLFMNGGPSQMDLFDPKPALEKHHGERYREKIAGEIENVRDVDRERILRLHHNAQRLLKPVHVLNPFAGKLTFLDTKTRARRDHPKYLTLMRTLAYLRQYQRARRTAVHEGRRIEYVEVTLEDVEMANTLAHEVLGRSLDDLRGPRAVAQPMRARRR
jgi:hypothetical protein